MTSVPAVLAVLVVPVRRPPVPGYTSFHNGTLIVYSGLSLLVAGRCTSILLGRRPDVEVDVEVEVDGADVTSGSTCPARPSRRPGS
jgi:hypothetical protein